MSTKSKKIGIYILVLATIVASGFVFKEFFDTGELLTLSSFAAAFLTVITVALEIRALLLMSKPEVLPERFQKILQAQEQSARLLIRRDLELNKANERLKELDERKSEFLSVVAHQLRTPLSGIKWTFNMILSGDLGALNENQRTFLMKGNESNQRMILLIEDMLIADRVGSGRYNYEFSSAQVLDLLENVLYEISPIAQKKGVRIEYVRPTVPKVSIDAERVRAVLQNILENAVKYSKPDGKVGVQVSEVGEFVQVAVSDDGIGIPSDQQKSLFNRFYRATNAIKYQTDGSGLGLFIVKGIIERHGGKVWFISEENKGSVFYFTLKKG